VHVAASFARPVHLGGVQGVLVALRLTGQAGVDALTDHGGRPWSKHLARGLGSRGVWGECQMER
jgi:hypothetical protein